MARSRAIRLKKLPARPSARTAGKIHGPPGRRRGRERHAPARCRCPALRARTSPTSLDPTPHVATSPTRHAHCPTNDATHRGWPLPRSNASTLPAVPAKSPPPELASPRRSAVVASRVAHQPPKETGRFRASLCPSDARARATGRNPTRRRPRARPARNRPEQTRSGTRGAARPRARARAPQLIHGDYERARPRPPSRRRRPARARAHAPAALLCEFQRSGAGSKDTREARRVRQRNRKPRRPGFSGRGTPAHAARASRSLFAFSSLFDARHRIPVTEFVGAVEHRAGAAHGAQGKGVSFRRVLVGERRASTRRRARSSVRRIRERRLDERVVARVTRAVATDLAVDPPAVAQVQTLRDASRVVA